MYSLNTAGQASATGDPTILLYQKINTVFPGISGALDAALSAWAELLITNISLPAALFFVGRPAGNKTNLINIMRAWNESIYVDQISPHSFVSHLNEDPAKLDKIDLLPQLPEKLLLTPEMNTFWYQPKDNLFPLIGELTRILDGQGYWRHSGVHGMRGFDGKCRFIWLAGTTPIPKGVWEGLGKLGSRLYFYPLDSEPLDDDALVALVQGDKSYDEAIRECRDMVSKFTSDLRKQIPVDFKWNNKADDPVLLKNIARYADLLARMRGHVEIFYDKEGNYEIDNPIIENHGRAFVWLYNLAKGHALIHSRSQISDDDLKFLAQVAASSAPYDRVKMVRSLIRNTHSQKEWMLIEDFKKELGITEKPIMKRCRILAALGVVELDNEARGTPGRPPVSISLNRRFKDLTL